MPLAVDLQPAASRETLPVTISLVVTQVAGSRDTRVLVVAPMVPGFEVSVADRRDVEGKARKALQRYARGWPAEAILNADERGWAGLETVEVEVGGPGPGVAEADEADVLGLCGVSLSARAAAGALGGADRRDDVVDALLATLVAEGPRSAVLVGPADVGKTAIVHEAVTRMLAVEEAPEAWSITAGALMAGMRMMGDWEERVQRLVAQARARRAVLVMGDPEEILSAGRWSKSDHNMARALRPRSRPGTWCWWSSAPPRPTRPAWSGSRASCTPCGASTCPSPVPRSGRPSSPRPRGASRRGPGCASRGARSTPRWS